MNPLKKMMLPVLGLAVLFILGHASDSHAQVANKACKCTSTTTIFSGPDRGTTSGNYEGSIDPNRPCSDLNSERGFGIPGMTDGKTTIVCSELSWADHIRRDDEAVDMLISEDEAAAAE